MASSMFRAFESGMVAISNWIWDIPLLVLLIGGGMYFLVFSRLLPFKYFLHSLAIVRGKYDNPDSPGQVNAFRALSTALSSTIGMGNIGGVAIAISMGGPGALFWMWASAFIGMATKYFTCSLAIMYRGKDDAGEVQGGPMYVIVEGLGKSWKPLAIFFAVAGLIGSLPIFTANQLARVLSDVMLPSLGYHESLVSSAVVGVGISLFVAVVIFGGIQRIANFASKLVPFMVIVYFFSVTYILIDGHASIIRSLQLVFLDAFTGDAVLGGSLGAIIIVGVRRAAFSNEAGIGTAPMAHGASKNQEPVREGLVAMLGPFIDTIIVCTLTALAILTTGSWQHPEARGISVTLNAFVTAMPDYGSLILVFLTFIFAITSLFTYSYYGTKCLSFLVGTRYRNLYNYVYIAGIIFGAISPTAGIVGLIDTSFALMAIPTMISTIMLAPKVIAATKTYFNQLNESQT